MKLIISLQPKQKEAFFKSFKTPVLFYGGAKGGGKSYLARAREVYRRLKYPNTTGLIVRRSYPELLSNHIRKMWVEYPGLNQYFKGGEKAIYYPNGSVTEFSYLDSAKSVYNYQGREYEDITIDEITQHEEEIFKILRTSNRTANKEFAKEAMPTMLLTGNPGGIGHGWVKRLFVDRNLRAEETKGEFDFVQAKVFDNKALLDADPNYLKKLRDLPDDLRRAYLEGDWDIFAGQVFSEFRKDTHGIRPYVPDDNLRHFLSIDWGYTGKKSDQGAFAAYESALVEEIYKGVKFNRVITYKEWYGKHKTPAEWARIMYNEMPVKVIEEARADPSMFTSGTGSMAITDLMEREWDNMAGKRWVTLKKADNNRLARVATYHNWLSIAPDGLPYWLITESCPHLMRTIPGLVYDESRVEDVDTEGEDHPYDAMGYGLMHIRFIPAHLGKIDKYTVGQRKAFRSTIMNMSLDEFADVQEDERDWRTV